MDNLVRQLGRNGEIASLAVDLASEPKRQSGQFEPDQQQGKHEQAYGAARLADGSCSERPLFAPIEGQRCT